MRDQRVDRSRGQVRAVERDQTGALALDDERLFEPLYGPGSAERFEALGPSRRVDAPNLMDDVDTLDDLTRLVLRLGPVTRAVLATVHLGAAA